MKKAQERTQAALLAALAAVGDGDAQGEDQGGGSAPAATDVPESEGFSVRDVMVGQGEPVSAGSRVELWYVGTIASTGRRFDANQSVNRPFRFVIGDEEVVEGFDRGVRGMRLGGQRIVTVPPALGYGGEEGPKGIPPNSTLQFDIKLVGVLR